MPHVGFQRHGIYVCVCVCKYIYIYIYSFSLVFSWISESRMGTMARTKLIGIDIYGFYRGVPGKWST